MAKTSRLKKLLIFGAVGVVLLLGAAALLLPALVDVDRYRPKIEELARDRLGREVQLGELGLKVFPAVAVTVDGLTVGDEGGGRLLHARQVRLGAALAPLLGGRLEIGRVVVEEAELVVRRLPDGSFEWMQLLGGKEAAGGDGRVSVAAVRLRRARVLFEDASVRPGELVRHELTDLDLEVSGLDRPGSPLDLSLTAKIPSVSPEARLSWEGRVGRDLTADGSLELEGIELAPLAPHAAALTGRELSSLAGRVRARLELKRTAQGGLAVEGTVAARDLALPREGSKPARIADLGLAADLSGAPGGDWAVDRFELSTGATRLAATGRFEVGETERTLVLSLPESTLRLDELRRLAEQAGLPLPVGGLTGEAVRLGGRLRAVFDLEGFSPKRLDLDGLRVKDLGLTVVRLSDGRFDFQGAPAKKAAAPSKVGGLQIAARDVMFSGLQVRFEDRAVDEGPVVTRITDLEMEIEEWRPGQTTPVRLSGRLAGGRAVIDGRAGPLSPGRVPLDLSVKLEKLDVAALAPYLRRYAGMEAESGRLSAESRVNGALSETLSVKGRLRLDGAKVQLPRREPVSLDLVVDHDIALENDGKRLRLRNLTIGLPGGPVSFDGRIDFATGGPPGFDVGTRGPARLSTDDLAYLIALVGARTGLDLSAREPLVLDARLAKRGDRFTVSGTAQLRKLLVRHPLLAELPLQVASADVALAGEKVSLEGLRLRLGESDLSGRMSLEGFDRHRVSFELASESADLDELFAFVRRVGDRETTPGEPAKDGADALDRTTAEGRLNVKRATWGGLAFQDFRADVNLAERRLTMKRSQVGLYGGTAEADLSADLSVKPARFETSGRLAGVAVQELLKAGLAYEDLSGTGGGRFRLAGRTGSPEEAVRAATGGGTLELVDGVVGGLNVLEVLKRAEVFGERSLATLGARLAKEGTRFDRLDAEYELNGGVLQLKRLLTDTAEGRITATGPVRLTDRTLNLDVVVLFTRELSATMKQEGSQVAKYFWSDREDAVRLPLKLVGPIAKPKGVIDLDGAIAQYAQRQLGRTLEDKLGGLFGGRRGGSEPAPETPTEPPAEPRGSAENPAAPAAGAPSVEVRSARLGGNFLVPDLKVEAVLRGTDLQGALVVVTDGSGRELGRDENAFAGAVAAHYAAGAARDRPASIDVRWELDGKRIAGKRDLQVVVTPRARGGLAGPVVTVKVAGKKLF